MVKYEIDVPSDGDVVHEMEMIVEEYSLGSALKERALFRLWRVWRSSSYLDIIDGDEDGYSSIPMYPTWGKFVKDFIVPSGISKSTMYSRLRSYSILEWLGYSHEEILEMMSRSSVLYGQSVNLLVDWDLVENVPKRIKAESIGSLENEEEAISNVRDVIDNSDAYDRVLDAVDHVKRDIIGEPNVTAWMSDNEIVFAYEGESLEDSGIVRYAKTDMYGVPEWVYIEIERKNKIKRSVDESR
jgi:hypothetical protein